MKKLLLTLLTVVMAIGSNAQSELTATYTLSGTKVASVTVETTGTAPDGSSANYTQTYNNGVGQMTAGNEWEMTLSGYDGYTIKSISLSTKSNKSGGAGALMVTAGDTEIMSIADGAYNTNWSSAWSTNYETITPTMTKDDYVVGAGENVVIHITASANSLYCNSVSITYVSASSIAQPTFSIASGEYTDAQSVEITAESGATIYYTTDGSTPTTSSSVYRTALSISETTTVKAIAVVGGESSNVANVAITIIPTITNIKAFKAFGAKAILQLNDAVVTAVKKGNLYMQDATGGICIYESNKEFEYTIGQRLNGTILGTYTEFSNLPEITTTDYTTISATDGEAPTPKEITIDAITADDYCTLVTIKNAHCQELLARAEITQDDNTGSVQIYTDFIGQDKFPAYQNFDITGILGINGSNIRINPRSVEDFKENAGIKATFINGVNESYTVYTGKNTTIAASTNSDGAISYSSNDDNTATVDNNGIITGVAAGTVTITVSVAASGEFPAASTTTTVTVKEAPALGDPVIFVATIEDKHYAMTTEVNDNKKVVSKEVTLDSENKVILSAVDQTILWYVDSENGYICNSDFKYLAKGNGNTDMALNDDPYEWTFDNENGLWVASNATDRAIMLNSSGYVFGPYAKSNATNKSYAVPFTTTYILSAGDNTGIVNVSDAKADSEVYNLSGQRVTGVNRGLYIINGKKVVVK